MKLNRANILENTHSGLFKNYQSLPSVYDEFFAIDRQEHASLSTIIRYFDRLPLADFVMRHKLAHQLFRDKGITFNVYSNSMGQEKIFPFDLLPRVIQADEWSIINKGLIQRTQALNAFLKDIYSDQKIIKDRSIPKDVIFSSKGYLPELHEITPPHGVYIHVAGIDLIREDGNFYILEDNLKVPSGVSYVLENRRMMKQLFPTLFNQVKVEAVDDYPLKLRQQLLSLAPKDEPHPVLVVLTPGPYNSAFFEHIYLAQRMGCPLVQNTDLIVQNEKLYMKTSEGLKQVHVLYRRTDDDFLDPLFFNPQSMLGIPGLMKAYRSGNVVLANAPGNGVADDKGVYPYVPDIIRYYMQEEPILAQVQTYSCSIPSEREEILKNPASFVIKTVNESGGYGIVIGAQASKEELEDVCNKICANPRDYIAQPLKQLSCCPTFDSGQIQPRRVDLRPFILTGHSTWVQPGGLTRVALVENSYIVNSSQGGGSKDTWVLGGL